MILKEIEEKIRKQNRQGFIFPRYDDFCFSNIPSSVLHMLGLRKTSRLKKLFSKAGVNSGNTKKVVLFLVDGFGYEQWMECLKNNKDLKKIMGIATLAPITAVFPSTTAAAMNTIHSGLTPQEHGLPEWWTYMKELDKIIATLPLVPIGEKGADKIIGEGADPKILFDGKTIYRILSESKIPSFAFAKNEHAKRAYSKTVLEGSEIIPFADLAGLLAGMRKKISETPGAAYFYGYWDAIDTASHSYGTHSKKYEEKVSEFFRRLRNDFLEKIDKRSADGLLILITSDHGQININPENTIYLNRYQRIVKNLKLSPNGNKILPWGSSRDVFLALKKEKVGETFDFLSGIFKGKADVIKTGDAIKNGLFGRGTVNKKFKDRTGDILILPRGNSTIWYEHYIGEKISLASMHGGLSPEEIIVPFAIIKASGLF